MRKHRVSFYLMLGCFVMLVYCHQVHFDSATPASRLDLIYAVIFEHRLTIDSCYTNTLDKALYQGHYYSDKAPGTAALALLPVALAVGVHRIPETKAESLRRSLIMSWVACAFSQALPATIGAAALYVSLVGVVTHRSALLTLLGLFAGSLVLPYSTMLFSHAQSVGLLCVTAWGVGLFDGDQLCFVASTQHRNERRSRVLNLFGVQWDYRRSLVAGFCAGLTLASEYTAGIVVAALWLYVALWRRAALGFFTVGAIAPMLLIPAYSWATVGSPVVLPYSLQASFPAMGEGLYAITWPSAGIAAKLLVGPTRGLFVWSPFLLMASLGYPCIMRKSKGLFWLLFVIPMVQVLVISGRVWDWQAGFCFGPRFLAPILPLLALPCALGFQRFPRLGFILVGYSIAATTVATLTDACADYSIYSPLIELNVPKFWRAEFSYNLGMMLLGLSPCSSVALFYVIMTAGIGWLWRITGVEDANRPPPPPYDAPL